MYRSLLFFFFLFPKQDFLKIKYINGNVKMYILSGSFSLEWFFKTFKVTAKFVKFVKSSY